MNKLSELTHSGLPSETRDSAVSVFLDPAPNCDFPRSPPTFRLIVSNEASSVVHIRNPLVGLRLTFQKPDGSLICFPKSAMSHGSEFNDDECLVRSIGRGTHRPLSIQFRSATLDGTADRMKRDDYAIKPQSSLEFVFECEKEIGDRILGELKDSGEKRVDVSAYLALRNVDKGIKGRVFRTGNQIALPVSMP